MKKKKGLKIYAPEARVLQVLYQAPRYFTSNEVAEKAGVSWPTAKKYLKKWKGKGLVKKKKEKYFSIKYNKKMEKEVWEINRTEIDRLLKK